MIGEAGGTPYIPLVGVGDVSTGVHGALAVLAALRYRDRPERGGISISDCSTFTTIATKSSIHQFSGSKGQMKPSRQGRI